MAMCGGEMFDFEKEAWIRNLIDTVVFFENRYEGTYEEVVAKRGNPEISDDWVWCREGKEWRSLIRDLRKL